MVDIVLAGLLRVFMLAVRPLTSCRLECLTDRLAEQGVMKHFWHTFMKSAGIVLLMACASVIPAGADIVGTLNIHTAADGHRITGQDTGQPIAVQVDFSRTQDGKYDITVWSGNRQFDKVTRVYVKGEKQLRAKRAITPA